MGTQYTINIPSTKILLPDNKEANKFLVNLKAMINEKIKDKSVLDGVAEYMDIWKALKVAEATNNLIVSEGDYKKVASLVKTHKGWGDFDGQLEALDAIEGATNA